jgi:hypothetical protein
MEKFVPACFFRSSDGLTLNYGWELVELSNDKTRAYFSRSKPTGTWMQNQCSLLSTRNSGVGWFLVPFSHYIIYEIKDSKLSFSSIFSLHSYSNLWWKVIFTFAMDFFCCDLFAYILCLPCPFVMIVSYTALNNGCGLIVSEDLCSF